MAQEVVMRNSKIRFLVMILSPLFFISVKLYPQGTNKISAASLLEKALNESGMEAATVKFNEMCAQKERYSFLESEFLELGNKHKQEGRTKETIAVLHMTREIFPNFDQAYLLLGHVYRSLGLYAEDLEHTNHAFEIRYAKILTTFLSENKESLAENAEQVLDRYFEAIGGRENLLKIKSMKMTLTRLQTVNQETAFIRYYKYPHFSRQTIVDPEITMSTDGQSVWKITSEGWTLDTRHPYKYTPDIYNDFINYQERGISYRLLGIEVLDSEVLYHVLKIHEDGHTRDYYFSAESGLFVMERRDWGIGKDIKRYFDWREVEGILIPHMFVVTNQGGLGHAHGAIIKDIKMNAPLDDALFIQK